MAENKKSVLLYCDIIHTVMALEDDEAGRLFKHYLKYINDLNPESDRLTELLFEPIKQNLKRDLKKWESKSERNSISAKEAWTKRKDANAYERIEVDAKNTDKVIVTETDKATVKVNTIEQRKQKFALTLEPFKDKYPREMLSAFYKYWTQPNRSGTKFKQELEKTWELSYRLETWAKRDGDFIKDTSAAPQQKIDLTGIKL